MDEDILKESIIQIIDKVDLAQVDNTIPLSIVVIFNNPKIKIIIENLLNEYDN